MEKKRIWDIGLRAGSEDREGLRKLDRQASVNLLKKGYAFTGQGTSMWPIVTDTYVTYLKCIAKEGTPKKKMNE